MADIHIWEAEQVKAFWDYESQFPENYWSAMHGTRLVNNFSALIKASSNILDLGCGNGALISHLLDTCIRDDQCIYGFDTSYESIQKTNERFANSQHFMGAFCEPEQLLNHSSRKMDLIFCCEVVEHLYDEDLRSLFNTAKSLLSPVSGRLIITTPNKEELSQSYIFNPVSNTVFHRWQHVRSWDSSSLHIAMKENGFDVCDILEIDVEENGLINRIKSRIKASLGRKRYPNLVGIGSLAK